MKQGNVYACRRQTGSIAAAFGLGDEPPD